MINLRRNQYLCNILITICCNTFNDRSSIFDQEGSQPITVHVLTSALLFEYSCISTVAYCAHCSPSILCKTF